MDRSPVAASPQLHDQVVVLRGVSWADYDRIDQLRGTDCPQPRLAYLDGVLQLMTTGLYHELVKKLLARLIEAFADEHELELIGAGNLTCRKEIEEAGLEPDECYWLDDTTEYPELALEIVHTSGGFDKLEIYRRLGVREVWFWIDDEIEVHRLVGDSYRKFRKSAVLRGIDLAKLAELARTTPARRQASVVREYRRSLRQR